jgi:hypothetical protein
MPPPGPPIEVAAPEPPAKRNRGLLIAAPIAAVLAIAIAVVLAIALRPSDDAPVEPGPSATATAPTPEPTPQPTPTPTPQPTATIVHVTTEPAGASVERGGVTLGITPVRVPVAQGEQVVVTISMPGYRSMTANLSAAEPEPVFRLSPVPNDGRRPRPHGVATPEPTPPPQQTPPVQQPPANTRPQVPSDNLDPWGNE